MKLLEKLRSLDGSKLRQRVWEPLQNLFRAIKVAATWQGQRPRVYLYWKWPHSVWKTYDSHPPLRYAPFRVADLCHLVNPYWLVRRHNQSGQLPRALQKPHILEIEHVFILLGGEVEDWRSAREKHAMIDSRIAASACKRVFTFSAGLVEHFKTFVSPGLWHKLDYIYPAFPTQEEHLSTPSSEVLFNVLVIASRFSDKGVPEALSAFRSLRERHGDSVHMDLVCQNIPIGTSIPKGVTVYRTPRLDRDLKAILYRAADVFLLPCYSESAACFAEAYAFGVPVITTRIHHGVEFVREGVTGYLVDVPCYCYSPDFGTRWHSWGAFLKELDVIRARGELAQVVQQTLQHLETLMRARRTIDFGRAARQMHVDCFSPAARNRRLLSIYEIAMQP